MNEAVTGNPLSAEQQADLKTFVSKYQGRQPVTEFDESNPGAPVVKVKVAPEQSGDPIVFDIHIQHN
jgi:hypothetical protein